MTSIPEYLKSLINEKGRSPFLFVGSGFSRRYLSLDNWDELLERFSVNHPWSYYRSKTDGDKPKSASLIADDFFEEWWRSSEYDAQREKYSKFAKTREYPLKAAISEYIIKNTSQNKENPALSAEIEAFKRIQVDGIITTNWDCFLEEVFDSYKVYVGQQELLIADIQNIGEIYKIHGCATKPESLILTDSDYQGFRERNPYLAAKLITIFCEYPIVFIGYSLEDENIRDIMTSVISGIGSEHATKFLDNLIFVQRTGKNRVEGISTGIANFGPGQTVHVKQIVTDDFSEVYHGLSEVKRRIPVKVLRQCKESFYTLIKTADVAGKIFVKESDSSNSLPSDVEFVIGVGVTRDFGTKGYLGLQAKDLFVDLILNSGKYDPEAIVREVLPKIQGGYLPVYKYLKSLGAKTELEYKKLGANLVTVSKTLKEYKTTGYQKNYDANFKSKSSAQIIAACRSETWKAALMLCFQSKEEMNRDVVLKFLKDNYSMIDDKSHSSYWKKLASLYDRFEYGW